MSKTKLISLVIVTKNRALQVEKNISSIEKQGVLPHEIIIVDSSKERNSVLFRMKRVGNIPVKYVHEPSKNIPQARNIGVKKTSGSIVLFIDDDCILPTTLIQHVLNRFKNNKTDVVIGKVINEDKKNIACCIQDAYYERWLKELFGSKRSVPIRILNFIPGLDIAAFKKDILVKHQFYEQTPFGIDEDIEISRRLIRDGTNIWFDSSMYVYHRRPNTILKFCLRTMKTGYANAWNNAEFKQDIHSTPYTLSLLESVIIASLSSDQLPFLQKIPFWISWISNPILYRIGYYAFKLSPYIPNARDV